MLRGRKQVQHSSFSLGKFGFAINIMTICWIALALVLFCMPVSLPVDATDMNYASVVFAGFSSISMLWYVIRGRKEFKGPPVTQDIDPADVGVVTGMPVMDGPAAEAVPDKEMAEAKM